MQNSQEYIFYTEKMNQIMKLFISVKLKKFFHA